MNTYDMLEGIAESLRPDPNILELAYQICDEIRAELEKREIRAEVMPGGSTAKGTHLIGSHDIDIFIRFGSEHVHQNLSDLLQPCIQKYAPSRLHGSRDYFQFNKNEFLVELIPVLYVTHADSAKNVTDMSPLHVDFFRAHGQHLTDEVRLLKQFCKVADVYGAESYIRGFSGHVVDLLVIRYGSFIDTIKAATKWSVPLVLSVDANVQQPKHNIAEDRHGPLIFVDPVQPIRNAAAALSEDKLRAFIQQAKAFMRDPSEQFFILPEYDSKKLMSELKKRSEHIIWVEMTHGDDKKDVAGAKIRKAAERIHQRLQKHDFTLVESSWHFTYQGTSHAWYAIKEHSLPLRKQHYGPPVERSVDANRFRSIHPDAEVKDGKLRASVPREYTKPFDVVMSCKEHILSITGVTLTSVQVIEEHNA